MVIFLRQPGYGLSLKEYGFDTIKAGSRKSFQNFNSTDIVWRWGTQQRVNCNLEINSIGAIRKLSDKYQFLLDCTDSQIRAPRVFKALGTESFCERKYLGRKNNHHGGDDIVLVDSFEKYREVYSDFDYFSLYLPKQREYRIYTFFGWVFCVDEKIVEDKTQIAWNHSQGSVFENVRYGKWPINACLMALKAAKMTEVDFAAWDIINYNHYFYMLEGNSAPAITGDYKLSLLSEAVDEIESNGFPDRGEGIGSAYKELLYPLFLRTRC